MHQQLGSSLFELIVSLLLLSVLLFSFDAIQLQVMRELKIADYYAIAIQQAQIMAEFLLEPERFDRDERIAIWEQQNSELLPNGRGVVNRQSVNIFWGNVTSTSCDKNQIGLSGCLKLVL